MKKSWIVTDMDMTSVTFHRTYRDAVKEAQNRADTNNRPRILRRGFYQLTGENHQYYISTPEAAIAEGFVMPPEEEA